jgi:UDP-N-acetylglucosamine transferase subunit ALG13
MIFVTVGTQGRFDRLVRAVDEWAGGRGRTDVFAQIGPSDFCPKHIPTKQFIDPAEFRYHVDSANLVVAHAGMGSIITALELGKPIMVMPRRASLGEHRNDHQVATAKRFAEQGRIMVAFNEKELVDKLDQLKSFGDAAPLGAKASPHLIATIRTFIKMGHSRFEDKDAVDGGA